MVPRWQPAGARTSWPRGTSAATFQVDDVDLVVMAEDVRGHLGIPEAGLNDDLQAFGAGLRFRCPGSNSGWQEDAVPAKPQVLQKMTYARPAPPLPVEPADLSFGAGLVRPSRHERRPRTDGRGGAGPGGRLHGHGSCFTTAARSRVRAQRQRRGTREFCQHRRGGLGLQWRRCCRPSLLLKQIQLAWRWPMARQWLRAWYLVAWTALAWRTWKPGHLSRELEHWIWPNTPRQRSYWRHHSSDQSWTSKTSPKGRRAAGDDDTNHARRTCRCSRARHRWVPSPDCRSAHSQTTSPFACRAPLTRCRGVNSPRPRRLSIGGAPC